MSIEKVGAIWLKELDKYSEEQFAIRPDEKSWSIGQVYVHLILGNDHFFMKNAELCLNEEGERNTGGKNKWGKILFAINGFPPMNFKRPGGNEAEPRQPENIEYVRNKLIASLEKNKEVAAKMNGYDPQLKVKHPAFGYLNADEWYRINGMHFKHHLRQKKKLDKFIGI